MVGHQSILRIAVQREKVNAQLVATLRPLEKTLTIPALRYFRQAFQQKAAYTARQLTTKRGR